MSLPHPQSRLGKAYEKFRESTYPDSEISTFRSSEEGAGASLSTPSLGTDQSFFEQAFHTENHGPSQDALALEPDFGRQQLQGLGTIFQGIVLGSEFNCNTPQEVNIADYDDLDEYIVLDEPISYMRTTIPPVLTPAESVVSPHGDLDLFCRQCGKDFTRKDSYKRHMERMHDPHAEQFYCGNGSWGCGKPYGRKDGLIHHQQHTVAGKQCMAQKEWWQRWEWWEGWLRQESVRTNDAGTIASVLGQGSVDELPLTPPSQSQSHPRYGPLDPTPSPSLSAIHTVSSQDLAPNVVAQPQAAFVIPRVISWSSKQLAQDLYREAAMLSCTAETIDSSYLSN